MPKFHVVIVDRASAEQLNAVQEIIKQHADGWWHHFANAWIVGGHDAQSWRDNIKPAIATGGVSVLVLALPDGPARNWAFWGTYPEKKAEWIHENYLK